jgi:hypothetical protein
MQRAGHCRPSAFFIAGAITVCASLAAGESVIES